VLNKGRCHTLIVNDKQWVNLRELTHRIGGGAKGDTLLEMAIKKIWRSCLIYLGRFRRNGMHLNQIQTQYIDHWKWFANSKIFIMSIDGSRSFGKERLIKYHGVNPMKFYFISKNVSLDVIRESVIF
jgi:hypothetical protein